MKEIALNILDIAKNSEKAGASLVEILIDENILQNYLAVTVKDNGCGMDADFLKDVESPFKTTQSNRKVGLGVPLFKLAAVSTGGEFDIKSTLNVGTETFAKFIHNSIDRMPLGDISATVTTLIMSNPCCEFLLKYTFGGASFEFDTREIKTTLSGVPIDTPDIISFLDGYIKENILALKE